MIFDKKRAVSVILSKTGEDGRTVEVEVSPETGEHDEYTSIAEDLVAHMKSGSVQGVAKCLRVFHELVKEEDEEQDAGV